MSRPSNRALCATLIGVGLVLIAGAGAQSASAKGPRLRLIEPARLVRIQPDFRGRVDSSQLGIQVAAYGGNFQINIWRPTYSKPFRAAQVSHRTGKVLHRIPRKLFSLTSGSSGGGPVPGPVARLRPVQPVTLTGPRLLRFVHVVFRDRKGHVAAQTHLSFCPGLPHQRVSDLGPPETIFPDSCDSFGFGNPFIKGMVMGIENHWSAPLSGYTTTLRSPRLDPGYYTVTAKIAGRYRRILGIPRRGSKTTFRLRVSKPEGGGIHPLPDATRSSAPRPSAAPPTRGVPSTTTPPMDSRPDLIALPAWQISLAHTHSGKDILGFSATAWNAGPSPMDVEGFRKPRRSFMQAYQYFRNRRGKVIGRTLVGHLDFDTRHGHDHWHFEQFAGYSLRSASGKRVIRSTKQSFCLAPTDPIDFTVPGADWNQTAQLLQTSCADGVPGALWVREVLQAGWGDTYIQSVAGQAFDVTDLPNGRYLIRIRVNPLGRLIERNRANDVAQRRIRITGAAGHRKVHVAPWHGISG